MKKNKSDSNIVAKNLYLSGLSIAGVAKRMKLSSSGVVYKLKKEKVILRNRSEAVRLLYNQSSGSYSTLLPKDIPKDLQTLYYVNLALYWGEGSKTGTTVALTNSDPDLVASFLIFLRRVCQIDEKRLHAVIHCHEDHNQEELLLFWSKVTKIPKNQFYKSTLHTSHKKRSSTKRLKFGTISLRYSDSLLLGNLLARIELLKESMKMPL